MCSGQGCDGNAKVQTKTGMSSVVSLATLHVVRRIRMILKSYMYIKILHMNQVAYHARTYSGFCSMK